MRTRLPLVVRLVIRIAIFIVTVLTLGLAFALARHFLVGPAHFDLLSARSLDQYQGAVTGALCLWLLGMLGGRSEENTP